MKLDNVIKQLDGTTAIENKLSELLIDLLDDKKSRDEQNKQDLLANFDSISKRVDQAARNLQSSNDSGTSKAVREIGTALSTLSAQINSHFDSVVRQDKADRLALKESLSAAFAEAIQSIPAPVVNVDKPDLVPLLMAIESIPKQDMSAETAKILDALKVEPKPENWTFVPSYRPDGKLKEINVRKG